jgi:hypothetical protein
VPATRQRAAEVLGIREARETLSRASSEFHEKGVEAEPIFFGPNRKAEGVILSYARYLELLDELDDLALALEIRRRDHADVGERLSLEELIRRQGYEPSDFGLE